MLKRLSLCFYTLFLAFWSLNSQSFDEIYVDKNNDRCGDRETTSGTAELPFCSIQDGLSAARDRGTVFISKGTYFENLNLAPKSVTIIGSLDGKTIIDGRHHSSVLSIEFAPSQTIQLANLVFVNGQNENGGAIFARHIKELFITDCIFKNNQATAATVRTSFGERGFDSGGGAIWMLGDLQINNSHFENNSSNQFGGAVQAEKSKIKIRNSHFTGNHAEKFGGAVSTVSQGFSIKGSSFQSNIARISGGAISLLDSLVERRHFRASIQSSQFDNNRVIENGGGAVFASTNFVEILIANSKITQNIAGKTGGGLHLEAGYKKIEISNSFIDNNRSGKNGGAIFITHSGENLIHSSTLSNNSSNGSGGGFAITRSDKTSIINSTLSSNKAKEFGGGLYYEDNGALQAKIHINHATIVQNKVVKNYVFDDDSEENWGAGIAIIDKEIDHDLMIMKNSILAENKTSYFSHPSGLTAILVNDEIYGEFVSRYAFSIRSYGYNILGRNNYSTLLTPRRSDIGGRSDSEIDPLLEPLRDNGGAMLTHKPRRTSPAIDAGNCIPIEGEPILFDQIGNDRLIGDSCDIGAVEYKFELVPSSFREVQI